MHFVHLAVSSGLPSGMSSTKTRINKALSKYEPLTIVAGTTAALAALYAAAKIASDPQGTYACSTVFTSSLVFRYGLLWLYLV